MLRRWCLGIRRQSTLNILGKAYPVDATTNLHSSSAILQALPRQLHRQPEHPIGIIRSLIESAFPATQFSCYSDLSPVVSTHDNFDALGFPANHPGRSPTDTFYLNSSTVLRTHTSVHQATLFASSPTPGFLLSADVYRRDAIDRSHYPAFHQMEGGLTWSAAALSEAEAELRSLEHLIASTGCLKVTDVGYDLTLNPIQSKYHTASEVDLMSAHLKRSVEFAMMTLFKKENLEVRWVEAYFPFTSPSWELEVLFNGEWLELIGCGIVQHWLLESAGLAADRKGWAFGLGLERLAMAYFGVPDIRLFWTRDARFLAQFSRNNLRKFTPYSRYPPCYKDVAFWGNDQGFHENDLMTIVRDIAPDLVEDVKLIDRYIHPKTQRESFCYRINYRSMDRSLENVEVNALQDAVRDALVTKLLVEMR